MTRPTTTLHPTAVRGGARLHEPGGVLHRSRGGAGRGPWPAAAGRAGGGEPAQLPSHRLPASAGCVLAGRCGGLQGSSPEREPAVLPALGSHRAHTARPVRPPHVFACADTVQLLQAVQSGLLPPSLLPRLAVEPMSAAPLPAAEPALTATCMPEVLPAPALQPIAWQPAAAECGSGACDWQELAPPAPRIVQRKASLTPRAPPAGPF